MCGIIGYVSFSGPIDTDLCKAIGAAMDTMSHRGPDGSGLYTSPDGSCVLGHRRLSIIDLSPQGNQPMTNEDASLWVVFNGEIYNYVDLRQELLRKGHSFRSTSDTEVILHLFEEEGDEFLERLDGEFAFVLYDAQRKRIIGARDRLGVKPLYYVASVRRFAFASEPKALLALPDVSREPRFSELSNYLAFNCLPGPATLFRDIEKLLPGSLFEVNGRGEFRVQRYWLPTVPTEKKTPDHDVFQSGDRRDCIGIAVRKRMVSDVPVGVMLSGGVDSSLVVALMSAAADEPVRTFTVGYPGSKGNSRADLHHARIVARAFQTDHREVVVRESDIEEAIEDLALLADDPIGAPSVAANVLLARTVRGEGVKVVQVGEGADEVFCGYRSSHRLWRMWERLAPLRAIGSPAIARGMAVILGPLLKAMGNPSLTGSMDGTVREQLRRYGRGEHLYWGYGALFPVEEQSRFFRCRRNLVDPYESIRRRIAELPNFEELPYLDQITLIDLALGLPERLLMRVDKATMLSSVEARVPFLDPRLLVETLALPPHARAASPKGILKEYARRWLPPEVVQRSKVGFPTEPSIFLNARTASRIREKILEKGFLEAIRLDRRSIEGLMPVEISGWSKSFYRIWSLYVLSMWFHSWIEVRR